MPCTVDPIYVDKRELNAELLEVCNKATLMLDRAREAIIAGVEPDLTYYYVMKDFNDSAEWSYRSIGPFSGYPENFNLSDHFRELFAEAQKYHDGYRNKRSIASKQKKHRRADIKRLQHTFAEAGNDEMLAKTLNIDYDKPLEEQLGFDPDEY